jgi:hypothetical protein
MIYGPKDDGTYVVEFMTAESDVLAISIPRSRDGRDRAVPRADALRAVCAGGAGGLVSRAAAPARQGPASGPANLRKTHW